MSNRNGQMPYEKPLKRIEEERVCPKCGAFLNSYNEENIYMCHKELQLDMFQGDYHKQTYVEPTLYALIERAF